jgi:hypothetical protein
VEEHIGESHRHIKASACTPHEPSLQAVSRELGGVQQDNEYQILVLSRYRTCFSAASRAARRSANSSACSSSTARMPSSIRRVVGSPSPI